MCFKIFNATKLTSQAFCKKMVFYNQLVLNLKLETPQNDSGSIIFRYEGKIDRFEVCRFVSFQDGDHETSFVNYLAALSISSMLKSSLAKKNFVFEIRARQKNPHQTGSQPVSTL